MLKRSFVTGAVIFCLLSQSAMAESATYHLKRLEIQARAFLTVLEKTAPASTTPLSVDSQEESASVEQQLEQATNSPTWAEEMAREDLNSLLNSVESLQDKLRTSHPDEYLKAKIELESLARRLRISTAPLQLDAQQKANLELTLLELEESIASVSMEREQQLAQKERRRPRVNVGVGLGYGNWGAWGPWGQSSWGYAPWGYAPYTWTNWHQPYPRFYRPGCR